MSLLIYPVYDLLPWDIENAKAYAEASVKHFGFVKDSRTKEERIQHAFVGALGEIGFDGVLKPERRALIADWPMTNSDFGNAYDMKSKSGMTIDIKTSSYSESVKSPEECNFALGFSQVNKKKLNGVDLCDSYIQMYVDKAFEHVYFIGALSKKLIEDCRDNKIKFDVRGPGYMIIPQKNFDMTDKFKSYF
jgi:hypothetical protein